MILGVAVLLDTMLVRLLLLPAVLRLLGERAWWIPSPLQRWLPAIRVRYAEPEMTLASESDTKPLQCFPRQPLVP